MKVEGVCGCATSWTVSDLDAGVLGAVEEEELAVSNQCMSLFHLVDWNAVLEVERKITA